MTQLLFCGQAPSRIGDGRPFSGPSGKRLANLLDLRDYEHLAAQVRLTNIFGDPAERSRAILCGRRTAHAGDDWDKDLAAVEAFGLLLKWHKDDESLVVVACGKNVSEALTGKKLKTYKGIRMTPKIDVWRFPHPSGASHYWNSPENVDEARRFLKKLLKRYGIMMA